MPFIAYVHAHDPDPRPEGRPPWEPNWRIWRWVLAAVILTIAAFNSDGALELLLVFVVFGLACRAAHEALPNGDGLREWRQ